MNTEITSKRGHKIRRWIGKAKQALITGEQEDHVSFVLACIEAGVMWPHLIANEAACAAGEHFRERIAFQIEEGENVYWGFDEDGLLYAI